MSNQGIRAALTYHLGTKLSYINLRNKPPQYKSYIGLPVIPLPTDFILPGVPTLDAVSGVDWKAKPPLDLASLAQMLFYSAGLVRKGSVRGVGEVHFRAAASAGALYPVETYLVCKEIPELEAGVYHFSPRDFSLHQLRKGDYRGELSIAAGAGEAVVTSPATIVFTAVFWRSAWKYRARSYRYCFWDNGTIVANLLAVSSAASQPARVVVAFVDERVNHLLGIQEEREATLCLVPIGEEAGTPPISRPLDPVPFEVEQVNAPSEEVDYPDIRHTHAASSLATDEEVVAWRGVLTSQSLSAQGPFYPLRPPEDNGTTTGGLGKVILGRGSTRRFSLDSISYSQFSTILDRSTKGLPADFLGPGGASLLDIYTIVNAVEGLPSGAYSFSPERRGLELIREGALRAEAGHLCYEQALGADASAVVFFMADIGRVLARYGDRGYRAVQLEAGIVGGRLYLCSNTLGLGATGLTFYDDEITDFFSPHAKGKSAIFVVALGTTAGRNRIRPFRSRVSVVLDALARGAVQQNL